MGAIGENAHIMGNIVEDEKITHDLFVKRLAFQMATIKEIEYVDKNGAAQILKRPTKVTMTVSMASPAAGTTGINFDRPVDEEERRVAAEVAGQQGAVVVLLTC